jgi:putative spermidine/putrescine transport system substrate-binding protein
MRRTAWSATLGLTLAAGMMASFDARAEGQLVAVGWGGVWQDAYRKAVFEPFMKESGIKVVEEEFGGEYAKLTSQIEAGKVTWDVAAFESPQVIQGCDEGSFVKLDWESMGGRDNQLDYAAHDCGIGSDVWSTVMAYDGDKIKDGPKTWADFWNVEKFPGRRSLRKNPIDSLEQALMADGVSIDQLYPLDVNRAFKSLDKIKQHVDVWWTGGAQSTQLLQSGEVDLISGWNARLQSAIDGGAPATIVWDQGLYSIEGWAIPKGCPRADAAKQFIKFCSTADRQAAYTDALAYGPTNLEAYKSIAPERAKVLPTSPENLKKMRVANENWWSENRAAVTERFNSWLLT